LTNLQVQRLSAFIEQWYVCKYAEFGHFSGPYCI